MKENKWEYSSIKKLNKIVMESLKTSERKGYTQSTMFLPSIYGSMSIAFT
jgi:hypothetical protein